MVPGVRIPLNVDSGLAFSNEHFTGEIWVKVKGAIDAPETPYFDSKARLFQIMIRVCLLPSDFCWLSFFFFF